MSTLLRNISTSESNLYLRELMLSCAIINLLGFFDLMFSIFEERSRFSTRVLTLTKYSDLIKMTPHFQD